MKSVLVTGGTGFVGANLVHRLLDNGYNVHLLVRASHQTWRIQTIQDKLDLHIADLSDETAVKRIIQVVKPQWIFHLATYGAYSWQKHTRQTIDTNLIGTVNLVNACLDVGFEAFINLGSSSEYGFKDHAPSEDEIVRPNSDYAVMKSAATNYCQYVAYRDSVPIYTLRLYSVYGAYEEPNRLIPSLLIHGLQGKLPDLVSPHIGRDFIHINDVLDACFAVVNRATELENGAIFNVGSGIQTTLENAVSAILYMFDLDIQPEWDSMQNQDWDTSIWVANIDKIKTHLDWMPKNSFEQGLKQTINWMNTTPGMLDYYQSKLTIK